MSSLTTAGGSKTCTKCKRTKPFSDYYKRSDQPDKYLPQCKSCMKQTSSTTYAFGISKKPFLQRKVEALRIVGGNDPKCSKCGCNFFEYLEITSGDFITLQQALRMSKKNIVAAVRGTIQEKTTIYCQMCICIDVCEKITGSKLSSKFGNSSIPRWTILALN